MNTVNEIEIELYKTEKDINEIYFEISNLKKDLDYKKKSLKSLKEKLARLNGNSYYVYIVFVEGKPKYVGKGTGDRYKHAVSGTSSVLELNRDFFNGSHIEVAILYGNRTMTEKEALKTEKDVIGSLMTTFSLYNRFLPSEEDYTYMDCDFKRYSDPVICSREYKLESDTEFREGIEDVD